MRPPHPPSLAGTSVSLSSVHHAASAAFVVWLNAGILLYFEGSQGSQYQLFALGAVLIASALLNSLTLRRRSGGF